MLGSGRRVIVEGGTNLYVDALMDGLSLGGVPPQPERRAELSRLSTAELGTLARELEPGLDVDFSNRVRLLRAIELLEHRPSEVAWWTLRVASLDGTERWRR